MHAAKRAPQRQQAEIEPTRASPNVTAQAQARTFLGRGARGAARDVVLPGGPGDRPGDIKGVDVRRRLCGGHRGLRGGGAELLVIEPDLHVVANGLVGPRQLLLSVEEVPAVVACAEPADLQT